MTERLRPKDRWARTVVLGKDAEVKRLIDRSGVMLAELARLRAALQSAVQHDQWFVICALCSIIGELVFVAFDPAKRFDKFPKLVDLGAPARKHPARLKRSLKRNEKYYLIAALRHTCFHPAMSQLIRDLPRAIFTTMASLHTEAAADWSLEQLDNAMQFELGSRGG